MATMHPPASVLQISSFKCILQRQCFYPASATTTTAAAAAGIATTTRIRAEPVSTAPDSLISVANFLVDSLEFSTQQALSTSIKITKLRQSRGAKRVCQSNFYRNADLVVSFLQQKGLEKSQIRKLVTSTPRILACRIEKNLEPKMNYFQEVGFSVSDFVDVLSTQPGILYYSLDSAIRPAVEALRAIMGSDEDVVRIIKGFKLNALPLVTKHLVRNVSLLQAQGIPIESIRKRVRQHSAPFIRKPATFKEMMARAETKWGVSPHSKMFLYAIHVLGCLNEKNIESKCQVFESFGWDRSDVVDLFGHNPLCLAMSEQKIKATLGFYMNELGYDPGFIIKFSVLLCYSLEKRVFPRHLVLQLLKDKGLIGEDLPFYRALSMNESQFLNKCIRPFEDKVPNLHDIYVNSIGSSAQHQIQRGKNNRFSRMRLKADSAL